MKNRLLKTTVALAALTFCTAIFVSAADEKKPAGPDRAEMMKQFDANGDGQLDQTEREAVRKHMESMRGDAGGRGEGGQGGRSGQGRRPNPMAEFDANSDGKLDKSERAAMREGLQSNDQAMKRFDTDGNGKLSDAEWGVASKAVSERMGQGARDGRGGERGNAGGGEGRRKRGE
tara:strand:+ start:92 stop:616 length:525 start_codon:yes stop_codon:yes gene_type:complete